MRNFDPDDPRALNVIVQKNREARPLPDGMDKLKDVLHHTTAVQLPPLAMDVKDSQPAKPASV